AFARTAGTDQCDHFAALNLQRDALEDGNFQLSTMINLMDVFELDEFHVGIAFPSLRFTAQRRMTGGRNGFLVAACELGEASPVTTSCPSCKASAATAVFAPSE